MYILFISSDILVIIIDDLRRYFIKMAPERIYLQLVPLMLRLTHLSTSFQHMAVISLVGSPGLWPQYQVNSWSVSCYKGQTCNGGICTKHCLNKLSKSYNNVPNNLRVSGFLKRTFNQKMPNAENMFVNEQKLSKEQRNKVPQRNQVLTKPTKEVFQN